MILSCIAIGRPISHMLAVATASKRINFSNQATPLDGQEIEEVDSLLKKLCLTVKGHEPEVLRSYEMFVQQVCGHFGLNCAVETRHSPILDRLSLNKSPFIHKKHQRQYEFKTYVKQFTIPHLTGCTANVFLEYVQRNLPAGVHMAVAQHRVERLPEALRKSSGEGDAV